MKNIHQLENRLCTLRAEVEVPYRLYKDIDHIDQTIRYELTQQLVEKILEEDLINIEVDYSDTDPLGPGTMKCRTKLQIIQN